MFLDANGHRNMLRAIIWFDTFARRMSRMVNLTSTT